jgi:hypothetical protein
MRLSVRRRPRAGVYADERYRSGLERWRRQIRWPLAIVTGPFFAASIAIYFFAHGHWLTWFGGGMGGAGPSSSTRGVSAKRPSRWRT